MVETVWSRVTEAGITVLTRDQPPSEPTLPSTPTALPLVERLWQLYSPMDPSDCRDEL